MKKLLLLFAIISIVGCSKPLPCESNNTGTLKTVSTEVDEYYTYVEGTYVGISYPATTTEFEGIPSGVHEVLLINTTDANEAYVATPSFSMCAETVVNF